VLSRRAIIGGISSLLATKPAIARRKHPQIGGGDGGGGGGGYVAKAVQFFGDSSDSIYLRSLNTGIASNTKYTAFCWVNVPSSSLNGSVMDFLLSWPTGGTRNFHLVVGATFNSDLGFNVHSSANNFGLRSDDGALPGDVWVPIFSAADTTQPSGSRTGFLLINGTDASDLARTIDTGVGFASSWENICIPAITETNPGADKTFNIAQLQVWVGTIIDPTIPENYAKFVNGGSPVDPVIAATAFGQQTLLFDGDASPTGFQKNQGTAGDIFTLTGMLTTVPGPP